MPFRYIALILDVVGVIADTLKAKKRLVEAGFSDEKAEGIVAIFNEADAQIATRLDLELFRKDVKAEIAKLDSRIDKLEGWMELLRRDLTHLILKAQFAGVVATVGILSALKFFS